MSDGKLIDLKGLEDKIPVVDPTIFHVMAETSRFSRDNVITAIDNAWSGIDPARSFISVLSASRS